MADETLVDGKTMEQASQEISDSLVGDLGGSPEAAPPEAASPPPADAPGAKPEAQPGTPAEKPAIRAVPKSWKQEYHEYWGKLDPKVQEYIEQRETEQATGLDALKSDAQLAKGFKEVLTPYQALLDAQGLKDPAYVVRSLLNTHYQLSTFNDAQKVDLFNRLAKLYKVDLGKVAASQDEVPFIDPSLKEINDRMSKVEGSLTAQQEAAVNDLRLKTAREVEAFASDPKHSYFNEVADHVVLLLQNPQISLEQAYEQAVWANPATRAKEQARISQESDAARRKEAEEAAAKARKAKGTDVRGKESPRGSTELVGSIDDTLRETYREVASRT